MENNVLSPAQDVKSFDTLKNGLDTPKSVEFIKNSEKFISTSSFHQNNLSCATSPELPDIRNIVAENDKTTQNVKTPPPPPPRWAKPGISQNQSNFTVTTTVTFNVNQSNGLNTSQVKLRNNSFFKKILYLFILSLYLIYVAIFLLLYKNKIMSNFFKD